MNLALLSTFLWTSWPSEGFTWVIWPVVLVVWLGSAIVTFLQFERIVQLQMEPDQADDTLLIRAQTEYLKGNWSEVQSLVSRQLKDQPRDIPARLLLATLFRHTGSLEKAGQQLDVLDRFDESEAWRFEIDRERELLDEYEGGVIETELEPGTGDRDGDPDEQAVNNLEKDLVETSVEFFDDDQVDSPGRKAA